MKLVINDPKSGKSFQRELEKDKEAFLLGKRVGEQVEGTLVGVDGYSLKVTGGTDKDGFPMRTEVPGTRKTRFLVTSTKKGGTVEKRKKTIRGNTVSADTAQVNARVVTPGAKPLEELVPMAPKEKKEEAKAQKKK